MENEQERSLSLATNVDHLKWGSTGVQEQIFVNLRGVIRPMPLPHVKKRYRDQGGSTHPVEE